MLLLDKPPGLSSNAALQRAKRLYAAEKAGHTGTLDPLATGLLPLCFGEATKFAQSLLDADKAYVATVRFGVATTTGDAEGESSPSGRRRSRATDLEAVLPRFLGAVSQAPPRHAALKFQGRNYYEYARAGIEIPRAARDVEIDAIDIARLGAADRDAAGRLRQGHLYPGAGRGPRGGARDCAHLTALRRTAAGPFAVAGAITLEALETLDTAGRDALLLPVSARSRTAALLVELDVARALFQGRPAPSAGDAAGRYSCFDTAGCFIGVVDVTARSCGRCV